MEYLVIAVQALVAIVFATSAVTKLHGREALGRFAATVRALRLVPDAVARPVAAAVGVAEAAIVALVVWPATAGFGLGLAVALLAVFTVGIARALRRGSRTPCRCFGSRSSAPLGWHHVARNLVLAGMALLGAATVAAQGAGTAPHPGGAALGVLAGVVAGLLVIAADDLVALLRPTPRAPRGGPRHPSDPRP